MLTTLLLACASRAPTPVPPAPPDRAHMQEVLAAANGARHALVAGDLRQARVRMEWLAEHAITTAPAPEPLAAFAEDVRAAAARGAAGTNAFELSKGLAAMAAACGNCHTSVGTGPLFAMENLPPGEAVDVHMRRHQWAVDSMWEGLVAPDDHRWRSGAFAFLEAPLSAADHEALPPAADGFTQRLHELGEEGLAHASAEERAALYAEIVTLCASCHEAAGAGPGD